jgi:hypothetical protein
MRLLLMLFALALLIAWVDQHRVVDALAQVRRVLQTAVFDRWALIRFLFWRFPQRSSTAGS